MRIVTADERLAEPKGPKIVVAGRQGIGKTSLLRTLTPEQLARTLFISIESGQSSIPDVKVDEVQPETWEECRDIACLLAGPDLALANRDYGQKDEINPYSMAHYERLKGRDLERVVNGHDIWFVDSLSTATTWCVAWSKAQSSSWSDKKNIRDTQGMYGEIGRQLKAFFNQIQRGTKNTVVYTINTSLTKDDFGRASWGLILDGNAGKDELLRVVDVLAVMDFIPRDKIGLDTDEANPKIRALACLPECDDFPGIMPKCRTRAPDAPANEPFKPALDKYEPPNLGELLNRLTAPVATAERVAAE